MTRSRMPLRLVAMGLLVCALAGCGSTMTNRATVYPLISGFVQVRWRLAVSGIARVEYTIDEQPIGASTDAASSFAIQIESPKFSNGPHTMRAVAQNAQGQPLRTVEHTLLIQN